MKTNESCWAMFLARFPLYLNWHMFYLHLNISYEDVKQSTRVKCLMFSTRDQWEHPIVGSIIDKFYINWILEGIWIISPNKLLHEQSISSRDLIAFSEQKSQKFNKKLERHFRIVHETCCYSNPLPRAIPYPCWQQAANWLRAENSSHWCGRN